MTSILLNDFTTEVGYDDLKPFFHPEQKVTVLLQPIQDDLSGSLYLYEKIIQQEIKHFFRQFQIQHITIIEDIEDDYDYTIHKVKHSDILVLVGQNAGKMMRDLEDCGLDFLVQHFQGVKLFVGMAAMLSMQAFYDTTYGYEQLQGLGNQTDYCIHPCYQEEYEQLEVLIHVLQTNQKPILVLPKRSGAIFINQEVVLIGEAFFANHDDLDELYQLKQRYV